MKTFLPISLLINMTWDTSVEISRYFVLSEDKGNGSFLIFFQDRIATDFQKTKLITYSKGYKFLFSLWEKNYKCGSLCNKRMFPIMPQGFIYLFFLFPKLSLVSLNEFSRKPKINSRQMHSTFYSKICKNVFFFNTKTNWNYFPVAFLQPFISSKIKVNT